MEINASPFVAALIDGLGLLVLFVGQKCSPEAQLEKREREGRGMEGRERERAKGGL